MHQESPTQNYLRKENQQLKHQIQELKDFLQINKQALRKNIKGDSQDIKQILKMLYKQNDNLRDKLNNYYDQISMMNGTMLIGQQIVIATQSHEKILIEELKQKIQYLKQQLKQKQKRIVQLEKSRLVQKKPGVMIKTTFVSTPTLLQMKHHQQIQILNQKITIKQAEIERQKQKNDQLFKINLMLNKQIIDNKIPATSVTSAKKKSNYQDLLYCHQQLRHSNSFSSYQSSLHSQSQQQDNKQGKIPKLSTVPNIPKLELGKAKQIQQLIVKKIDMKEKKKQKSSKSGFSCQQKTQLQKQLQQQKLLNLLNERKISKQCRIIIQLQQRNKILIENKINKQNNLNIYECPSQQYQQQLNIRNMLQMAREVYFNQTLQKIINSQYQPQHFKGALTS